jgi:flagellar basal-body rod protein FlgF
MSKGIYTAVSGAIAQSQKLDTIANNLANVNTPGFKRDQQVFSEYLTAVEKDPGTITAPRVTASIESFYDMQGNDKAYVDAAGTYTDFTQGMMKQTGNKLDVGLEGDGLFEVATPEGVRYTRSGSFSIDSEGRLVTKQGFPVLKDGGVGAPAQGREIRIAGSGAEGSISIGSNGEIFQGESSLGKLAITKFGNKDALRKVGHNMYTVKENLDPQMTAAADTKVNQGMIEGSNVNIVREMTEMIAATRVFESTQKAIQAYDSMNGKAVNEVPKLK